MPEHHVPDPYTHYSFDGAEDEFTRFDPYNLSNDYNNYDLFGSENQLGGTPLFLAAAANKYLDTTVTKFLENDISVTKFLA